jgi:hypothetical protein
MTRKKQMLQMIERLPEDVSYDRAIYHLTVLRKIDLALEEAERGEGMEHEEFFRELAAERCPEPESSGRPGPKKTSAATGNTSRGTRPPRRTPSSAE